MHKYGKTKMMVTIALLIAMEVVLTRVLSINLPALRIGFGFVPIAVCAIMFGPLWAGVAGALADIIGITLIAHGTPFPGFTVSAALVGVVFGLFLRKSEGKQLPIFYAAAINCFGIGLFMNTFWLTIITGSPFYALFPMRFVQALVMTALQFISISIIEKRIGKRLRKFYHG